jgi:glycosyltransferase involved in cell wall biosynthesis
MRVCHIISGDLWAGAEVMCFRLLKGLQKIKDIELHAILLNDGKLAYELRRIGVPITIIDESKYNFFHILIKIRNILKCISPDVLHSHRFKENILSYLSVKFKKNIAIVCTQHGMPEPLVDKKKVIKKFILSRCHFSIISRKFAFIIAVSSDVKNALVNKYGFPNSKVVVIHNGTYMPEEQVRLGNGDDFVIGSAGRFFPVKDYSLMVHIARDVLRQADRIQFLLAGDGPEKERITSLIRDYKLGQFFHMTGFVDDMEGFYKSLDLYINTSLHEGLPMGILEAMSYGIPVIAPKCGGLSEIIDDGIDGYLIEGRNSKDYAEKCLKLFSNKELQQNMGVTSRKKILNNFTVEIMARNYMDLYNSTLKLSV